MTHSNSLFNNTSSLLVGQLSRRYEDSLILGLLRSFVAASLLSVKKVQ